MKKLMLLLMLIGLNSCDWYRNADYSRDANQRSYERRAYEDRLARQREDRERARIAELKRQSRFRYDENVPPPDAWLSLDFACSGSLRRAQWLVCEHDQLGLLHRRLALQWEAANRSASPERLSVLAAQQNAFVSERNACEDAGCVAAAYNRYLDGYQKPATPWQRPTHPWHRHAKRGHPVTKVIVKKHDRRDHPGHDRYAPDIPHSRSCVSEIGFASAQRLGHRCDAVTPGLSSQCSVHNNCASIRAQTDRGCGLSNDKPEFCRHY